MREGVEAWRGDTCTTSVGMLLESERHDGDAGRTGHENAVAAGERGDHRPG